MAKDKNKDEDKNKNQKIAVVLFNLGGPDSLGSVKIFLYNLFNDKYIIKIPSFFRKILAWLISNLRNNKAQKIYDMIGGKSPILAETTNQSKALFDKLQNIIDQNNDKKQFKIFICMRHFYPQVGDIYSKIDNFSPDKIILLPLYPQFSSTTSLSSIENFMNYVKKEGGAKYLNKISAICCYPVEKNFIKSHVNKIDKILKQIKEVGGKENDNILLFSAHGLPKSIIEGGDSYQWQVERSVDEISRQLRQKYPNLKYKITYQSRVGPKKWLTPDTEEEILYYSKKGAIIIICPIAFVSEHVETLVELDIEYKEIADKYGAGFFRVPTLSIDSSFIDSLASMVYNFANKKDGVIASSCGNRICPEKFTYCPCNQKLQNKL